MSLKIIKSAFVHGRTLSFRDAVPDDAEFILSLRLDEKKGRHLSTVSADVSVQRSWLERYRSRIGEAYFIILFHDVGEVGTVRIYDDRGDSFCWGSWILGAHAPRHAAIESALMVYAYAIDHLGFGAAHFDVRKENESVWRFHERFGALRVADDGEQYRYILSAVAIAASRKRYSRYLPGGVILDGMPT